jgi:hypothetical protein
MFIYLFWLLHDEIADALATKGFKGDSYCPTDRFDALPEDTEPEDIPEMRNVTPLIMQMEECDEEYHLPRFGKAADVCRFEEEEARDHADETFNRFSRDVLGNSSAVASDESDSPQREDTIVMTGNMSIIQEGVRTYGQYISQSFGPASDDGEHMTEIAPGLMDSPAVAPQAWSTSFAQARSEAIRQQAEEERFSWMTEADQDILTTRHSRRAEVY